MNNITPDFCENELNPTRGHDIFKFHAGQELPHMSLIIERTIQKLKILLEVTPADNSIYFAYF